MDEDDALRDAPDLRDLLSHYAALDRNTWHPRRGEGGSPRAVARLHGELIAHGWIEQNTGSLSPGSYRATRAGVKALERIED
ncbi:MAG: hypothetical protein K2W96_18885 [Gemmataceae bacterium]|nr:hypothetical protein [Gemmataceae bacterium]